MYTYAAKVWGCASSKGPLSVAPCGTLTIRTFLRRCTQGAAHLPGEGFECHSVLLVQKHTRIRCTAGIGVGNDVQPVIDVGGQNTSATNTIGFNLTYTDPYITSVSPSDTEGGTTNGPVSINGGGFGPAGERWNAFFNPPVLLGGRECTDPVVTVDDTQIQCMPPPGTGTRAHPNPIVPCVSYA